MAFPLSVNQLTRIMKKAPAHAKDSLRMSERDVSALIAMDWITTPAQGYYPESGCNIRI
jgi:hypothetical protein